MRNLARRWSGGGFGASVAVLVSGSAIGQVLTLAVAPILTRLYTPEELGVLAVFASILAIGTVAICFRYEVAIPLPDDDATARDLAWLCLGIATVASAAVGVAALALAEPLSHIDAVEDAAPLLVLLAPSLFGIGVIQVLTYWSLRRRRFPLIGAANATQAGAQAGAQVGMGAAHLGAAGLLVGYALGRLLGAAVLVARLWRDASLTRRPTFRALRSVGRAYRQFPALALWSSLLNSASAELPVLVVAILFGSEVVGFFGYTVRVLQTPMGLVGIAVGQVYYANVAGMREGPELRETTLGVFRRLVALATGPLLLVLIAGPALFAFVFGEEWRQAGSYAQWLAPWLFVVFIASPLSSLVFVLNRQRQELVFQSTLIAGRLGALFVGAALGTADLAIHMLGVVSACLWAAYLVWLLHIVGAPVRLPAVIVGLRLGRAALISVPVLLAIAMGVDDLPLLLVLAATAIALGLDAVSGARRVA